MVSEDQSGYFCRKIEDSMLAGGGLLGKYVENWNPFRMLQVKRVEHRVGDVQQSLSVRDDGQRDVSRRVSGRGNSPNTGHDLGGVFDQGQMLL